MQLDRKRNDQGKCASVGVRQTATGDISKGVMQTQSRVMEYTVVIKFRSAVMANEL